MITKFSIDTNLLFYALNSEAGEHEKAKKFVDFLSSSSEVVIAELVLVELYILLRNTNIFSTVLSPDEATDIIQRFRSNPRWQLVENAPVMHEVWDKAKHGSFARRKIFDVRLALTLKHHGVTHFATANTKDFEGLGFERVWNPLLEEI